MRHENYAENAGTKNYPRTNVNLSYSILEDNPKDPNVPPILVLHGLLGHKGHWKKLAKSISNLTKRSVITVDLRNHGYSPHVSTHSYKEMASDVLLLCKKLEIKQASLIGHSMGGRTAMCASLMAPETVAEILVIDISPISTATKLKVYFPKILAAMKEVKISGISDDLKIIRKKAKRQLSEKLDKVIAKDPIMRAVMSNINIRKDGTVGWLCNVDVLVEKYNNIAYFPLDMLKKTYPGPTLFIGGELSEFIPPDDLHGICKIFPQAVVTYVPKAGHNVHVDDPESFLKLAAKFMKSKKKNKPPPCSL